MAALNDGAAALELAQRALHHLVGHGIGEKDRQIRAAQLVPQAAGGLGEDLRLTLVAFAKLPVAALHTFVAAKNYNAHRLVLSV